MSDEHVCEHDHDDHKWFDDLSDVDKARVNTVPLEIVHALQAGELSAAPATWNGVPVVALTIQREDEGTPDGMISVYPMVIVITSTVVDGMQMPDAFKVAPSEDGSN